MARPYKEGLDYFELNCYMDEKLKMIQVEYGLKGFAVVVKLWMTIYREHGYYCEWTSENKVLFMSEEGVSESFVDQIVTACIRRNIFSREMFEKYQILTSRGIQKRYFNAISRRKTFEVKREYLLVSVGKNLVYVSNNSINASNNSINADNNSQRKEKKRKE